MLGKIVKQIREDREISQSELYDGLISKRQAIRFEQDEADVKGIILIGIMERLGLTRMELSHWLKKGKRTSGPLAEYESLQRHAVAGRNPEAFSFYSKYRFSKNKQSERLAVLASLLLDDQQLEERDLKFLLDELVMASTLTLEQIAMFLNNIDRFPGLEKADILKRVGESIVEYQKLPVYPVLVKMYGFAMLQFYLFEKPNLAQAKAGLMRLEKVADKLSEGDKIQCNNWRLLVDLASSITTDKINELSKRAQLLILLVDINSADLLIKQRYLVEKNFGEGMHEWTPGEIGVVAREVNQLPKDGSMSAQEFVKTNYPNLLETVKKLQKPFSSYLNNYEY